MGLECRGDADPFGLYRVQNLLTLIESWGSKVRKREWIGVDTREPDDFPLPYLVTFSMAAETCNFSATAKTLRLSQAAVSQRIQILEKTLAKELFKRQGGRVLLTEAGQKLYAYAQKILEIHREIRREVTGHETPITGALLLGASSVPGECLLPEVLSGFREQHPHVHVRAMVTDSRAVMTQVERGEVNIGLVGQKAETSLLDFRHFASDKMVVVVPPGHVLGKWKQVSVQQLSNQPLILREGGSGTRDYFEKCVQRAGWSLSQFPIALELGSNSGIKEAVARGLGVAVLSTYVVQKELRAGTLLALDIHDLPCDREMFIVQDKRRVLPIPARLFLSFLEKYPLSSNLA